MPRHPPPPGPPSSLWPSRRAPEPWLAVGAAHTTNSTSIRLLLFVFSLVVWLRCPAPRRPHTPAHRRPTLLIGRDGYALCARSLCLLLLSIPLILRSLGRCCAARSLPLFFEPLSFLPPARDLTPLLALALTLSLDDAGLHANPRSLAICSRQDLQSSRLLRDRVY